MIVVVKFACRIASITHPIKYRALFLQPGDACIFAVTITVKWFYRFLGNQKIKFYCLFNSWVVIFLEVLVKLSLNTYHN
jgi:hypothetical protein